LLSHTHTQNPYLPPTPKTHPSLKVCIIKVEFPLVQVEIELWTLHSPHQTQLLKKKKKNSPTFPLTHKEKNKRGGERPLHSMAGLLIGCMEILFLKKLAAILFILES
jgi:hypothetical protein